MSLLERIADRLGEIQQELLRDRYPYLTFEPSGFSRKWIVKDKGFGCRPVKAQAAISMAKNPPPLPGVRNQAAPTSPAPSATPAPPPPSPKQAADASRQNQEGGGRSKEEDCPQPPPFDMLDIPGGMDAMGFTYAAYCVRRWFNGQAHVIADKSNANVGKSFVDDSTCKLSWLRKFGNVQQRYERLVSANLEPTDEENIFNEFAERTLQAKFRRFMAQPNHHFSGALDALAACGNDIQTLHQRFQFQRVTISTVDVIGGYNTVMNDLAASLANFNLYAAVASARVSTARHNRYDFQPWRQCVRSTVEITHVYVYAKDTYSFNDDASSSVSQYLGHWNRQGVIITVDAVLAEQVSKLGNSSNTSETTFRVGICHRFQFT